MAPAAFAGIDPARAKEHAKSAGLPRGDGAEVRIRPSGIETGLSANSLRAHRSGQTSLTPLIAA